jgi:hypothetical protein
MGGLRKEELIAAPIYANLLAGLEDDEVAAQENRLALAALALQSAEEFLALSAARRQPAAPQETAPPAEPPQSPTPSPIIVP